MRGYFSEIGSEKHFLKRKFYVSKYIFWN